MKKHRKYLNYVLHHKWYVYRAGRALGGIPLWRLIIHDYSKFSRAEWTPYVNRFFGGRSGVEDKSLDPDEFHRAWTHHWHRNPHHWEYWLRADGEPMRMPTHFAKEMLADWLGAGRGITGSWDLTEWYAKNRDRQKLHPSTKTFIDHQVANVIPNVIAYLESNDH